MTKRIEFSFLIAFFAAILLLYSWSFAEAKEASHADKHHVSLATALKTDQLRQRMKGIIEWYHHAAGTPIVELPSVVILPKAELQKLFPKDLSGARAGYSCTSKLAAFGDWHTSNHDIFEAHETWHHLQCLTGKVRGSWASLTAKKRKILENEAEYWALQYVRRNPILGQLTMSK